MPLARIEFALGEFAAYEFGHEALASIAEASFHGAGAAVVVPVVSPIALGSFAAEGVATPSVAAVGVVTGAFAGAGSAGVSASVEQIQQTGFSATGEASVGFDRGELSLASFSAPGIATAAFDYLDGPGFDVITGAEVVFFTSVVSDLRVAIVSEGAASFAGQAHARAQVDITGAATVSPLANSWAQAGLSSTGASGASVVAQGVGTTRATAAGAAAGDYRGQARANMVYALNGAATLDVRVAPLTRVYARAQIAGQAVVAPLTAAKAFAAALYGINGQTQVLAYAQRVDQPATQILGFAVSRWLRGRQVLLFIDPAFDSVERPEELRTAERPEELRSVERV